MVIKDLERFLKAETYAKELGNKTLESWEHCISSLRAKDVQIDRRIEILNDRFKHCFIWHWIKKHNGRIMVGGLMLHNYEEVFCVSVSDVRYPHWELHT